MPPTQILSPSNHHRSCASLLPDLLPFLTRFLSSIPSEMTMFFMSISFSNTASIILLSCYIPTRSFSQSFGGLIFTPIILVFTLITPDIKPSRSSCCHRLDAHKWFLFFYSSQGSVRQGGGHVVGGVYPRGAKWRTALVSRGKWDWSGWSAHSNCRKKVGLIIYLFEWKLTTALIID